VDGGDLVIVDPVACKAYGALTEGIHVAGYTLERAWSQLEWLLEESRWQRLGDTFPDVNKFLDSVRLDNFRIVADQRKRIADRIRELQPEATNSSVARLIGVSESTVRNDRSQNNETPTPNSNKQAPTIVPGSQNCELTGPEVADLARKAEAGEVRVRGEPRPDAAAQRGQPNRDGPDFWPTPHCLTTALVRYVLPDLPAGPIWECAAGDSRLVDAISAAGRSVIATDLYPQDDSEPLDFLLAEPPANTRAAIAITNPPFNQGDEFLARGLALLDAGHLRGLVLLLRHDHLMAATKIAALNRATREIHCNWRPIWIPDSEGNPRWSFHWLVWHAGPRQPPLYVSEPGMTA
jgi:hypothetical protein